MEFHLFLPGQWWSRSRPIREIYREILDQAVLAEELGYDLIWLSEQNLVNFLAAPDPLQLAAQIALRTERIRIGVGVFVLPLHHPLRLAGSVAQIDQLSDGRFDVMVGRGASPYQLRVFQANRPTEESREFFKESLGIMIQHWDGLEHAHKGRFFEYEPATVLPLPVQQPHPRLWIGVQSPESFPDLVGLGYDVNFAHSPFRNPFEHVERVYRMFDAALEQHARPRESSKFMINRMTFVADTEEEAWKAMPFVLANHRVIDMTLLDLEKLVDGAYSVDQRVSDDEPELEEMYRNISFGTPDVVRKHIHRYADLGLDVYSSWHNIGQPHEAVCRSMELFATEVMPEFQARSAGVV